MRKNPSILPWVVWGTAALLYAIAIIDRSSLSSLGPAAQQHFGIDAAALAAFPLIQLFVYAGCQIPVGVLLDRFGSSVLLVSGGVLMMAGQLVMATVSHVELAILARVLVGAGDACTFTSVMRILPEWFKPRQLPVLGQVTGLIGQVGQLVSVAPLALVVSVFGWKTGFVGVSAAGLLMTLIGCVVLRDAPGTRTVFERVVGRTGKLTIESSKYGAGPVTSPVMAPPLTSLIPVVGGARAVRHSAEGNERFITRLRRLMSIPGVRLAYWVHFVTPFSAQVFLLLWGTPFLIGGLGMTPAAASGMLSLTVVSSMVVGLVLGPLSSRYIERRVWLVVWITLLIAATWVAVIVWPGMPPGWLIIALLVILPFGGPASMIAFEVARSHTPRSFAGFGMGFVNTAGFTAALIVIMLVGLLLDAQGAGSPETYSLHAFKVAFAVQVPFWILGLGMIFVETRRTKAWMHKHGRRLR